MSTSARSGADFRQRRKDDPRLGRMVARELQGRNLRRSFGGILPLVGVVIGGLALRRSAGRIDTGNGSSRAIVALAAGVIALVNGGLNLPWPRGPGTGNGVVGAAAPWCSG